MAHFRFETPRFTVCCDAVAAGRDLSLTIYGGDKPHVGCTALAIPRPSLTGSGTSATVSVINATGHKDDAIATAVARQVASRLDATVACTAGIHLDAASPETIQQALDVIPRIVDAVLAEYQTPCEACSQPTATE